MASYVVPQVEIHQLFSEIPIALTQNQVPFVFGPNYLLHRYGAELEKEGTYVSEYSSLVQPGYKDGDDVDALGDSPGSPVEPGSSSGWLPDQHRYFYPYPNVLDPEKVEKKYTKLFADNCVVSLAELLEVRRVVREDGTVDPDELDIYVNDEDFAMSLEITRGRKLRVYCVKNFSGTIDKNTEYDYITDVSIVDLDPDAKYDQPGSSDSTSPIRLRVMIDEELDPEYGIAKAVLCEIQNGVEIPEEDIFDPNKNNFNWRQTHQLDVDGKTTLFGVEILTQFETYINDEDFKRAGVKHGKVLSADMYITYRELLDNASDTIHSIRNVTEVANALGTVHPDNPLAQAVYNAALNAGGQIIRYMAVPTDDEDGYDRVLNAATLTKEVYFFVPVTRDRAILDKVQSHVNAMSAPTSKRWRIAFVSAEIPDTDTIYERTATTGGREFAAKVLSLGTDIYGKQTADVEYVMQVGDTWIPDPDTRFKKDVKVGDVLVLNFSHQEWGKVVPQEYLITKILSNNRVRVSDPLEELDPTESGEKSEIYHIYTNAEKAEVIRNLSSSFADRRMYNVFPSIFTGGGVVQTGEFAAACVAGLVSSCLPQQPITNLELVGIQDVPLTYQTFSYDDLNTMASGGTFIVMQDLPNDQVYVRHQISTAYEDNNLNTAELSITKNLDSISFYFDNLLSPYIGKYNITPELLEVLHNVITGGLVSLENTFWGLYGPQVIADGTEILLLEQDAVLKDHVNCNLKLNLPYPFNHLVLKLFV